MSSATSTWRQAAGNPEIDLLLGLLHGPHPGCRWPLPPLAPQPSPAEPMPMSCSHLRAVCPDCHHAWLVRAAAHAVDASHVVHHPVEGVHEQHGGQGHAAQAPLPMHGVHGLPPHWVRPNTQPLFPHHPTSHQRAHLLCMHHIFWPHLQCMAGSPNLGFAPNPTHP